MRSSIIPWIGVLALSLLRTTQAKAVFAHYMVSGSITQDHAKQDIDSAAAVGLDGFVLNIGDTTQGYVGTTLDYLFWHAAGKNFKLFISMDLAASKAACAAGSRSCNGPSDFDSIFAKYMSNSAYALGTNGLPMISTYTSGGVQIDAWNVWKNHFAHDMYFIPMFDDTAGYYDAASGWWSYWGGLVDGLFSWEAAWPAVGDTDVSSIGQIGLDMPVMDASVAQKKGYMIGRLSDLSWALIKLNIITYNTNLYRAGELNLPVRMSNILSLPSQPDYIEFITWNDGPESHYIGTLWPETNTNPQATIYASQTTSPHTAWQSLLTSFIHAYKSGLTHSSMTPPPNTHAIGALWYKTILQSATCPNNAPKPKGWETGRDSLNWAVVIAKGREGMKVRVISDGVVLQEAEVWPGLNWGSPSGVRAGVQQLEVVDSGGNVVSSASGGKCVSAGCPDGIYNMNYQVAGLMKGSGAQGSC